MLSQSLERFLHCQTISGGVPCLVVNRHKQHLNAAADKSSTYCKWIALVKQHENSVMYTFTIPPILLFTHKGPAKSTPTLENVGASLTLNSGNAVVGGELYDFPFSFLQVTHSFNTPFTSCLPFGTQYFECNLANVALTPLRCKHSWLSRIISLVKWGLLGKMKGLLASRSKSEFTSLPSHLKISPWFTIPSLLTSCSKLLCFL